ncbi:MAG: hypothetical protein WAU39_21305 [Polyangiales bacterium]
MKTQPRMSAPIGRMRIGTSESRTRRDSGTGRWRPADPPTEADVTEATEAGQEAGPPRFYPFPLRSTDSTEG